MIETKLNPTVKDRDIEKENMVLAGRLSTSCDDRSVSFALLPPLAKKVSQKVDQGSLLSNPPLIQNRFTAQEPSTDNFKMRSFHVNRTAIAISLASLCSFAAASPTFGPLTLAPPATATTSVDAGSPLRISLDASGIPGLPNLGVQFLAQTGASELPELVASFKYGVIADDTSSLNGTTEPIYQYRKTWTVPCRFIGRNLTIIANGVDVNGTKWTANSIPANSSITVKNSTACSSSGIGGANDPLVTAPSPTTPNNEFPVLGELTVTPTLAKPLGTISILFTVKNIAGLPALPCTFSASYLYEVNEFASVPSATSGPDKEGWYTYSTQWTIPCAYARVSRLMITALVKGGGFAVVGQAEIAMVDEDEPGCFAAGAGNKPNGTASLVGTATATGTGTAEVGTSTSRPSAGALVGGWRGELGMWMGRLVFVSGATLLLLLF